MTTVSPVPPCAGGLCRAAKTHFAGKSTLEHIDRTTRVPTGDRPGRRARRFSLSVPNIAAALFLLAVLAAWQYFSQRMPAVLLPSPERVAGRFFSMWTTRGFTDYVGLTIYHVLAAVVLAVLAGLAIALLTYFAPVLNRAVYERLAPFLNSFPGVGWAYLGLIWFGITSGSVIFASAIAMVPLAIINIGAGLRALDTDIVEMAESMSRRRPRRVRMIILPLLLPYLTATVRLCFGVAWQIVLVVELLCGAKGLGSVISVARQRYWTDMIFAVVILVLALVFLIDRGVLARIQARIGKTFNG